MQSIHIKWLNTTYFRPVILDLSFLYLPLNLQLQLFFSSLDLNISNLLKWACGNLL